MIASIFTTLFAGGALGLATAPHCLVMCGPLAAYSCQGRSKRTLRYQSGRLAGYVAAGFLAGGGGGHIQSLVNQTMLSHFASWTVAAVFLLAAYRLWPQRIPEAKARLAGATLSFAPSKSKDLPGNGAVMTRVLRTIGPLLERPFTFGSLTVLLPCGARGAALILAFGSGSALLGAVSMLGFTLTSSLGLLAVSWIRPLKSLVGSPWARRTVSLILVAAALLYVVRPMGLMHHGSHDPAQLRVG